MSNKRYGMAGEGGLLKGTVKLYYDWDPVINSDPDLDSKFDQIQDLLELAIPSEIKKAMGFNVQTVTALPTTERDSKKNSNILWSGWNAKRDAIWRK